MPSAYTLTFHNFAVTDLLQLTSSIQDVVHLYGPTTALASHPMFLSILKESIYYRHVQHFCKVYYHLTFCVPILHTKPALYFSTLLFSSLKCPHQMLKSAPINTLSLLGILCIVSTNTQQNFFCKSHPTNQVILFYIWFE